MTPGSIVWDLLLYDNLTMRSIAGVNRLLVFGDCSQSPDVTYQGLISISFCRVVRRAELADCEFIGYVEGRIVEYHNVLL